MRGEQAIFNLEIKKKSGLTINPDIHHSKVFSSGQFVFTMVKKISQIPQNMGGGGIHQSRICSLSFFMMIWILEPMALSTSSKGSSVLAGTAAAPLILILKLVSSSRKVYTLYSFQRLQNFTEYMVLQLSDIMYLNCKVQGVT